MEAGKLKVVVTGANGQVGHCIQKCAPHYPAFEFYFLGREHLPVDNHKLAREVISAINPFAVINTAAFTAVDMAERETTMANSINGYAAGNLAKHCALTGIKFLHLSTDYVFDGLGVTPHTEKDETRPVNAYGASKLLGEQLVLKENPEAIIIRTSWVYSAYGHNFVKTMRRLFEERDEVKVVNDQWGSPTNAMDLANAMLKIAGSQNPEPGIYHYCNKGVITWFQLAEAIREAGNYTCRVLPISTAQFPTTAKRPAFSALDCQKISATFGIELIDWRKSLNAYFGKNA